MEVAVGWKLGIRSGESPTREEPVEGLLSKFPIVYGLCYALPQRPSTGVRLLAMKSRKESSAFNGTCRVRLSGP